MRVEWAMIKRFLLRSATNRKGNAVFWRRANLGEMSFVRDQCGVDEKTKMQVGPEYKPITSEYLDYKEYA